MARCRSCPGQACGTVVRSGCLRSAFLIAVLANMTRRPESLELVEIDSVPGVDRFVGMGQLAPQVLAWFWPRRRELTDDAFSLAREAWDAYRDATPLLGRRFARSRVTAFRCWLRH